MRKTGIKYTCDRCGFEHFVDFDEIDMDTRQYYDSMGSRPRNWSYVQGCYLCPDCGKIYTELFEKFLTDVKQ